MLFGQVQNPVLEKLEINARIANPPESLLAKYTRKEKEFFFLYADFVLHSITTSFVKDSLGEIVEREGVSTRKNVDVRIMVFPARPLVGRPRNILHGSYNQDSAQISLYPLKMPRDWVRREGSGLFKTLPAELSPAQRRLLGQIFESAVSTLIHEILHVKFEERNLPRYLEEAIVRKLEEKYFQETFGRTRAVVEVASPIGM